MNIVWSPLAVEQARDIGSYIALDKLSAAEKWIEGIFSCVEKLIEFPEIGRIVPEIKRRNIREVIRGNYRVIYKISGHNIHVLVVKSYQQNLDFNEIQPK